MSFSFKELFELGYWKMVKLFSKNLNNNSHYKHFYTTYFSLDDKFYTDKVILDIGCGPRGSLEWADMTAERIGVDPLAKKYLEMGAKEHKMTYKRPMLRIFPFRIIILM